MPFITIFLIKIIEIICPGIPGWLLVDDTLISKNYSIKLPGVDFIFNTLTGGFTKGFSIVVITWTNGIITIPLDYRVWFTKEISEPFYLIKIELAQDLISEILFKRPFYGVLADGLYASTDMMKFLNKHTIKFNMRMASNRVVTLDNGTKCKLKELRSIKPLKNVRSKTISATWQGMPLHFTAEVRVDRHGEKTIVYIVSNYRSDSSKDHVRAYKLRWNIECFFRTAKQSLGLQQCFARSLDRQKAHIYAVFISYTFLQIICLQKKLSNVEQAIKAFKDIKSTNLKSSFFLLSQFFEAVT